MAIRFSAACCAVLTIGCIDTPFSGEAGGGKGDIWGDDDRKETHEIETASLQAAAKASVGIVQKSALVHDAARDMWSASPGVKTLAEYYDLCPGQRFETQPALASCSGTLIADDIIVSAGHCFEDALTCDGVAIVFDLAYASAPTDPMSAAREIPGANVYRCAEMLSKELSTDYEAKTGADYAVFRLDRKVTGRKPSAVNWTERVEDAQPAYVIGHPSGIPQKIATGEVLDGTTHPDYVVHDADVFGGNSGGGLFDRDGKLIGIHVFSSAQRYVPGPSGTCNVVAICGENAECMYKPHAYDPRAMKTKLSTELQIRVGVPQPRPPRPYAGSENSSVTLRN